MTKPKPIVILAIAAVMILIGLTANWCIREVLVCPYDALKDLELITTENSADQNIAVRLKASIDGAAGCQSVSTEIAGRENMIIKIHCFPGKAQTVDYSFQIPPSINKLYYGYGNDPLWTRTGGLVQALRK